MAKDMTGELRAALYRRSSVFIGSMETPTERIVYHIIYDALQAGETVIWICLRETPSSIIAKFSSYELPLTGLEEKLWFVDATITGDKIATQHATRCASMDYICFAAHTERILNKYPRSLVMLDSIGILAVLERVDVTVRLIKYLDSRIRAAGGGLMTMLTYKPGSVEAEIIGLMDTVIVVEEEEIHAHVGSRELKISFDFSGSKLIPGSGDIEKDLRELFNLTSEEKETLELEVEEKVHLYREFIR